MDLNGSTSAGARADALQRSQPVLASRSPAGAQQLALFCAAAADEGLQVPAVSTGVAREESATRWTSAHAPALHATLYCGRIFYGAGLRVLWEPSRRTPWTTVRYAMSA
jgi:hypothetical protein